MQAYFTPLGSGGPIQYITTGVFLTLSPSLRGFVSFLSATLCFQFCHLFMTLSPVCETVKWATETGYVVCQPVVDMPGRAPLSDKVSNKEPLIPGNAGQVVVLSSLQCATLFLSIVLSRAPFV